MTNLVSRGYFNTRKVAGRTLILRSEAESLAARPKGRPRQEASEKKKTSTKSAKSARKHSSDEYISQAEAARIRGVSQPSVADLIRRGRLTSVSVAGRTLVIRSEVEAFVAQPIGRPPKKKTRIKTPKAKTSN